MGILGWIPTSRVCGSPQTKTGCTEVVPAMVWRGGKCTLKPAVCLQLWKARLVLHSEFTPNLQEAGLFSPKYGRAQNFKDPMSLIGVDIEEAGYVVWVTCPVPSSPCCTGISASIFCAPFCGQLTPFEYWIYRGLVPKSNPLFLDGTMCTFLLQLMLLSPCALCQRTLALKFTTENSFAGQVSF